MHILKHDIGVTFFYNENGEPAYLKQYNTKEKIKIFNPEFASETQKLVIKKETKKYYIVVEIDEDGDEREEYISKVREEEKILLNIPVYANYTPYGMECLLYTLDDEEEIKKGKEAVCNHYAEKFAIAEEMNKKIVETLKNKLL